MISRNIEFGVVNVEHGPEQMLIDGRCYNGPIVIGDTFEAVYQLVQNRTSDGYDLPTRVGDRPVKLKVQAIWAYGQWLGQCDPGLPAKLQLSGIGGEVLRKGDVLGMPTNKEM